MRGGSRRYFVVPSLALAGLNGAEHCTPRSMLAVARGGGLVCVRGGGRGAGALYRGVGGRSAFAVEH